MPTTLGEGMTGSRKCPGPAPKHLHTITVGEGPYNHTLAPLIHSAPAEVCIGPVRRQDRSSSLTLRALRLDPRSLPDAAYTEAESQQNPRLPNTLTEPHPFRDDQLQPWDV